MTQNNNHSPHQTSIRNRFSRFRRQWAIPLALVLLGVVPLVAGASRIAGLAADTPITPDNARFFASPTPVVVHIVSSAVFSVLGAIQFVPELQSRRRGWHRYAGRMALPAGLISALSGMWMTSFYPYAPGDGAVLYAIRLVVGPLMAVSLLLGLIYIRRRDYAAHRAWVVRGYAIGMGAGTQVFTHVPWMLLFGTPSEFERAMLMAAGWVINMVVAEWAIARKPRASSEVSATGPLLNKAAQPKRVAVSPPQSNSMLH